MQYCDRCGAQAKARWTMDTRELLFCGHHNAEHWTKLDATGWLLDHQFEDNLELQEA
jgi:hypothetical protein